MEEKDQRENMTRYHTFLGKLEEADHKLSKKY
jgi:hypothetical protein